MLEGVLRSVIIATTFCAQVTPAVAGRFAAQRPHAPVLSGREQKPRNESVDHRAERTAGSLQGNQIHTRGHSVKLASSVPKTQGGTACHCVCGHTVVWQREIFKGDVVHEKKYECEEKVCPAVSIPGLIARAECSYVEDIRELTAGTICLCLCGDQVAWRGRAFYGNVVEKRERECLEEVCPIANPLPGLRFEARCRFVPELFQEHGRSAPANVLAPEPRNVAARQGTPAATVVAVSVAAATFLLGFRGHAA